MPTLRIPTPLRPYADGTAELQVAATDVASALGELTNQYPALSNHLFTEDGELRSFVNLFLNDEDVRYLQGTQTQLTEEDSLMIVPSIAGGTHG